MRHSIALRLAASLVSTALFAAACAQRASTAATAASPSSDGRDAPDAHDAPWTCVHSDTGAHLLRMAAAPSAADGRVTGILRGTDHELIRNASFVTMQPIGGGATLRARSDTSGRFTVTSVPPGKYELRVVSIGYLTSRDTITVARGGASLELTQVIMRFLDEQAVCGYIAAVDAEPPLTPARRLTSSATHALPGGGSVQTSLTVRPQSDGASLDLLLRNVGTTPVDVFRLCAPQVVGEPVRRFGGTATVACYGIALKLAPGDTVAWTDRVELRGNPGDFSLRVHAADPATLDAVLTLPLVRGRLPRRSAN